MIGTSLFIGQNIELTAINPEKDVELVSSWTTDQEFVKEFLGGDYRPYSAAELKKAVSEKIKKADENHNSYYFAIREIGKTEIIGLLIFGWIWSSQQTGRIFLFFDEVTSLEKYGDEVLKLGLRYAYMELSLHRLWTELSEHNPVKLAKFESAGFLRETQRKEALFFDGKYFDQLDYALLKPEWKKLQEEVEK